MQLELLESKHLEYLKREFGVEEEEFRELCELDDESLEPLFKELMWKECDAAEEYGKTGKYSPDGLCAIELIDIICGPYNEAVVNAHLQK